MRSFTNDSIFDETLPAAEACSKSERGSAAGLKSAMEDWFRRKELLSQGAGVDADRELVASGQ